ncbi:hypothetical protein ZIOFF_067555 [Zingiber officinale]|uniref:Protein kinase domain-containing protein n=1 Tax=Zingiber officinale TaxID=94328 RepID=A0A8J5BK57_ZINOF|nr:hypothetical protein ZIOFF_067555 [Zingiber officinale]
MNESANVFHRDLKSKNILANADCKLKICDLGLARVSFNDAPSAIFWTNYVATRWYRAPELCGSFFSKYTPAIDIWSIGCIFAEMLTGRPLFPGKNVVHQLDLMTDFLGTPSAETIARVVQLSYVFFILALELIRLSANLPILKSITARVEEVLHSNDNMHLCLERGVVHRKLKLMTKIMILRSGLQNLLSVARTTLQSPPKSQEEPEKTLTMGDGSDKSNISDLSLLKSASTGASKCVDVKGKFRYRGSGILICYLKMERKNGYQNTQM